MRASWIASRLASLATKTGVTMCGKHNDIPQGQYQRFDAAVLVGQGIADAVEFVGALRERHVEGVFFLE